jgi:hypothetical protein
LTEKLEKEARLDKIESNLLINIRKIKRKIRN